MRDKPTFIEERQFWNYIDERSNNNYIDESPNSMQQFCTQNSASLATGFEGECKPMYSSLTLSLTLCPHSTLHPHQLPIP